MVFQLILTAMLVAAPPLTAPQAQQLATAHDNRADTDEGALYPLLENALTWPAHVEAGAMIPDYTAIEKDPAAYRGQLFFIQGKLRRSRPIGKLALPGPWEGKLSEWAIQYGSDAEHMLIVNLVNPPPNVRDNTQVKLAARFYKLWPTTNKFGQPKTFLVFVGNDAQPLGVTPAIGGKAVLKSLALVLVLVVFGLFWIIRRTPSMSMNPKPTPRLLLRRQARELQEQAVHAHEVQVANVDDVNDETSGIDDDAQNTAPLPADPAQALAKLSEIPSTPPDESLANQSQNSTPPPDTRD